MAHLVGEGSLDDESANAIWVSVRLVVAGRQQCCTRLYHAATPTTNDAHHRPLVLSVERRQRNGVRGQSRVRS